jgi:hypothetical protein
VESHNLATARSGIQPCSPVSSVTRGTGKRLVFIAAPTHLSLAWNTCTLPSSTWLRIAPESTKPVTSAERGC